MLTLISITLQAVAVIALADFVAGTIHWAEDRYFDEDTPVLGPLVIRPNIVHHHLPRYFTRLSWWDSSWILLLASALFLGGAWALGCLSWHLWLFAILSVNANQVHKWAHRTRAENGRVISFLQDIRLLQTTRHHGLHHTDPKNTFYCPITNFVNPVLERLKFWAGAEAVILRLTGIRPREDTAVRGHGPGPGWLDAYRRPKAARPVSPAAAIAQPVAFTPGAPSATSSPPARIARCRDCANCPAHRAGRPCGSHAARPRHERSRDLAGLAA